jgi:hypothetical protein
MSAFPRFRRLGGSPIVDLVVAVPRLSTASRGDVDVAAWLRETGLEHYEPVFGANEIDRQGLSELTDADLKDFGVPFGPAQEAAQVVLSVYVDWMCINREADNVG